VTFFAVFAAALRLPAAEVPGPFRDPFPAVFLTFLATFLADFPTLEAFLAATAFLADFFADFFTVAGFLGVPAVFPADAFLAAAFF
jgi:hypothetical protein